MRHLRSPVLVVVVAAVWAVIGFGASASAAVDRGEGQGGAYVVSEKPIADRILDLTVQSPALGRTAIVRLITPVGVPSATA